MAITLVKGATTYTMPDPMQNGYTEVLWNRGSAYRMASGGLVRERTNSTLLRRFTIEWAYITAADRTIIDNAVSALLDGGTATLTNPLAAGSYTVVLDEKEIPEWKVTRVRHGGTVSYRFSGKLVLEQVP